MAESSPRICVAALTYKRPEGLERLLNAFAKLRLPESSTVSFIIVDNDPECSAREVVKAASDRLTKLKIRYVMESEPGIPAGRNRALDEALAYGADLLCFTDDDAWPDPNWLISLVDCQRKSRAVLVFGPQRFYRPAGLSSLWKRFIARSLEARSRFVERFCEKQAGRGRIATSGTYNWLGDLGWLSSQNIRFDPALRYSGGSDTAFRESVRKKDGRMAWCTKAVVFEEIPESRLSVKYQLHRSRVQGINAAQFDRPVHPAILRNPLGRIMTGVGLIILPILGFASFSLGLHQLGMGIGLLQARAGARADLYPR